MNRGLGFTSAQALRKPGRRGLNSSTNGHQRCSGSSWMPVARNTFVYFAPKGPAPTILSPSTSCALSRCWTSMTPLRNPPCLGSAIFVILARCCLRPACPPCNQRRADGGGGRRLDPASSAERQRAIVMPCCDWQRVVPSFAWASRGVHPPSAVRKGWRFPSVRLQVPTRTALESSSGQSEDQDIDASTRADVSEEKAILMLLPCPTFHWPATGRWWRQIGRIPPWHLIELHFAHRLRCIHQTIVDLDKHDPGVMQPA